MNAEVDAVIIGGGIQGLLILEALQGRGYATALVTDGDVGGGQTLHSHGFLNTGMGMLGDALQHASIDVVQPYLRAHGVEPSGEWRVVPPPGFAAAAQAAPLPAGFEGPLAGTAVASPDRNVAKRRLVAAVSNGLMDRIICGRASLEPRVAGTQRVTVRTTGGVDLVLGARVVVVAAGCGTKRILEDFTGRTPQTEQIQHRRVHMICVRAPRGSLPVTSVLNMPAQMMLVAHEDADAVTWYVTPMEFGGPAFDDVPTDGESPVEAAMVARGFESLLQMYPRLPNVAGVQIGAYAGYRQDIGDLPAHPLCEPLAGVDTVVVALPSGLLAPWLNAARVTELVAARAQPSGNQTPLPEAGTGVRVGEPVEDRPGFRWLPIDEFARRLTEAQPASSSSAT
jgi:glycine/D-amino acid oxidase-like deaminating enzyme